MARRKKSRKGSKCPEPFNTLIDIAGGLAMSAVADHMEKKYHYTKKGKVNPYAVSAIGIGSGKMKSTDDLLRTGAFLGAMGSFDVDADDVAAHHSYVPEDPVFREIRDVKPNDNRYAWRLNCEDGSSYGVSPDMYETRDAYNAALSIAKGTDAADILEASTPQEDQIPARLSLPGDLICLRVSRLDTGLNEYFLCTGKSVSIGDIVTIPTESGTAQGVVIGVDKNPANPENIPYIL